MFILDMIIVALFMLYMEKKILKEKYILFSPFTLAQFALLYIYILPFLFYGNYDLYNYVSRLETSDINLFLLYLRVFYYAFSFLSLYTFIKIYNKVKVNEKFTKKLSPTFMLISIILLTGGILVGELFITNFNIGMLFDKLLNPREYTYLKEGLGMFTHIVSFSKLMLLYISTIYFFQSRNLISFSIIIFSIALNFLGGSKSTLLIALIFLVIIKQKSTFKFNNIKFSKLVISIVILSILLISSFILMRTNDDRSTVSGALEGIVNYSQEAYHSTNVINDFEWSPNYIRTVAEGLVFTPIPRVIFPNKDYYGLYNDHWRPLYQSNTVQYHTSTYGFLAEGHMLFGVLAPIIYAVLFCLIFYWIYVKFYETKSYSTLFFIVYLSVNLYFLLRTGLFMTTGLWLYILYFIAAVFYFLLMNKFNYNINKGD